MFPPSAAPSENFRCRLCPLKAAGEQAVLAAVPSATILRPSVVFGPEGSIY
jgi:NADH dehydrogenase